MENLLLRSECNTWVQAPAAAGRISRGNHIAAFSGRWCTVSRGFCTWIVSESKNLRVRIAIGSTAKSSPDNRLTFRILETQESAYHGETARYRQLMNISMIHEINAGIRIFILKQSLNFVLFQRYALIRVLSCLLKMNHYREFSTSPRSQIRFIRFFESLKRERKEKNLVTASLF